MRYKLTISYDGSNYYGFQKQYNKITIQETIEKALLQVLRYDVSIIPSGRTDAGVSAFQQICHFDIEEELNTQRCMGYLNNLLPNDIRVLDIEKVNNDFHARYGCKRKTYEYYFYVNHGNIPIYDKFATNIGYNLDVSLMKQACTFFKGEHDFSSFCASNTSVVNKIRTIFDIDVVEVNINLYKLTITGNGFLYNMVRIIMGTLVGVGIGKIKLSELPIIIESKDRVNAGKTMPAKGLYLKNVEY